MNWKRERRRVKRLKTGDELDYEDYVLLCLCEGNYAVISNSVYLEFIGVDEVLLWLKENVA